MKRFLLCALVLLPAGLLPGQTPGDDAPEPREVPPVHTADVTELAMGIRSLYLREDHARIRPALAELQEACRELNAEDRLVYGEQVVRFDMGLHKALDRTRELAADGEWADSEIQYEWVLRTCTRCHQASRKEGFGPALPLR